MTGPVTGTPRVTVRPRSEPDPRSAGPLVTRLGRRLAGLRPEEPQRYGVSYLTAGRSLEPGWIRAPAAVGPMVGCAGEHLSLSPAVAGARMAGSLGYAVAGRLAVSLAVTGRAFDPGPASLLVRLDEQGLVERVGVLDPTLAVPAADPIAGRAGVIALRELDDVIGWAADRVWATLDPLIDELHEVTRYGRIPMWNLVADSVLDPATVAPGLAGLDQVAGRAAGQALLDALVRRGAPIHRRGTLREPAVPGEARAPVRGSCCLHFRLAREKCGTCPLTGRPGVTTAG